MGNALLLIVKIGLHIQDYYLLYGLPRSGKSTLLKQWRIYPNRVVVNADSFRKIITGKIYHRNAEPQVWAASITAVKALLSEGYTVLFDETNSSEWSIKRMFEIDPAAQYVMLQTEPEICIERAKITHPEYAKTYTDVIWHVSNNLIELKNIEEIRNDVINQKLS